jgi:hypothetical protein
MPVHQLVAGHHQSRADEDDQVMGQRPHRGLLPLISPTTDQAGGFGYLPDSHDEEEKRG